ncbi:claudin-19 isoform 2-T2 [Pholidichthys leucotaenia]
MASLALQLLGFLVSLTGAAATVAATFMVEWKKRAQASHRIYEGLWMTCSGNDRTTCEMYESVIKLPPEIQAARAVLLLSLFISALALIVSTVGMKCTRFMEGMPEGKATTAVVGGIMFMVSGLLTIIITSWFVSKVVQTSQNAHHLESYEFGKAVFVSWAGGLLTMTGGAFLSCRICCQSRTNPSNSNEVLAAVNTKANYV